MVKKFLKAFLVVIFIFGFYYLIRGGVLIKMPQIEIKNKTQEIVNLNCDELKKYKDLKEVPENLKEDFKNCFKEKKINEEYFKIIELKNDQNNQGSSSFDSNVNDICFELENLPYSEVEIFNSSTLREKYKNCLDFNDLENSTSSSDLNKNYYNNYYDLNTLCPLFEPIKDLNECDLIIDEFGRSNCKICKSKGY